jgi:isocitrate dehydrogenase
VTAELTGSVGLAGSANVGDRISMFEAIHGSAPDIAGRDIANPSAMLNAACMMLAHLGLAAQASTIQNAWLTTLEDGVHTGDIFREGVSVERVGTRAFADAVIARMGRAPRHLQPVHLHGGTMPRTEYVRPSVRRECCGVDVFVCDADTTPDALAARLQAASAGLLQLKLITNRGVKVWPGGFPETFCTDHWRCRFVSASLDLGAPGVRYEPIDVAAVPALLARLHEAGVDAVKTENLYLFDGERGFTLGQGE